MRPIAIPRYIRELFQADPNQPATTEVIRELYPALCKEAPVVSIVIPAYNEEAGILQTLLSLCHNTTQWPTEIIVINNASTDRTEELVKAAGIPCVMEPRQGVAFARNAGLSVARGTYILNADADTIYPTNWIEQMVMPLATDAQTAVVYGRFAFIPTGSTGRLTYCCYEYLADCTRWFNKTFRNEAMNVYGFNSGFRREQGIAVDGFHHPPGANEDGWLALKLREKGFGKLYYVTRPAALVWTTDRRIQLDGGLWKGIWKRLKRIIGL
ncbi:MAG: glycosyltransferase family 2 protein [Sphingobacteriia bacterium]|nr:glycosyltransferase family 2 protein [Sphingobacteriia bacterium]